MIFACKSPIDTTTSKTITEIKESDLYIKSDIDFYSLAMSSVPGIPLTGRFKSGKIPENVKYHWSIEYGSFLSWEDDGVINDLGSDFSNFGEKIYWTPEISEKSIADEKIEIILELKDITGMKVLARAKIIIKITEDGFSIID